MLKVENLSFSVNEKGAELNILSDISFDVKKGEMLVITGPNGGGKSTLAKVLMGIEKAESGKVILDGEDITDYDIDAVSYTHLDVYKRQEYRRAT